jgi:hypothetical protein
VTCQTHEKRKTHPPFEKENLSETQTDIGVLHALEITSQNNDYPLSKRHSGQTFTFDIFSHLFPLQKVIWSQGEGGGEGYFIWKQ